MTTEAFTPPPSYVIDGIGPYAVGHEYNEGALTCIIDLNGVLTELSSVDFSASPTASETSGNVYLSEAISAAYDMGHLYIIRNTKAEQGWVGVGGAREVSLEKQVDRLSRVVQELQNQMTRTFRVPFNLPTINFFVDDAAERAGRVIICDESGNPKAGPTGADIENAQPNAAQVALDRAAVEAARTEVLAISETNYQDLADLQAKIVAKGDGTIHTTRMEGVSYIEDSSNVDVMYGGIGLRVPAPVANISSFGADAVALQAAFDWAHRTKGELIQDNDIDITTNIHHGDLRVKAGGGSWNVIADENFVVNGGGVYGQGSGAWADEAAILTRSANGNALYSDPNTTQYLVNVGRGVNINNYVYTDAAPRHTWRIIGMKEGSDFYATCYTFGGAGVTEASPVDFYFFNRATIGGFYIIFKEESDAAGGLWVRDIGIGGSIDYMSHYQLDDPICYANGKDEAIAIYTVVGTDGYIRATGSCTGVKYGDYGLGVSILNNNGQPENEFSVTLDTIHATANIKDGQAVVKIRNTAALIGNLIAIATDAQPVTTLSTIVKSEYEIGIQGIPKIGNLEAIFSGTFVAGDGYVDGIYGDMDIACATVKVMTGASRPKRSVANNLRGYIRGGEIAKGESATVSRSRIHNTIIHGSIVNCEDIFGVTQYIDTDVDTSIMVLDSAADFGDPNRARYHAKIIPAGVAAIPRVISSAANGIRLDVDYHLDCDAAGGEPPEDTFINTPRPYAVSYRTGGIFKDKARKSGSITPKTLDADGYTNILHGLAKPPRFFTAYSALGPQYIVTPTNLDAGTGTEVRVRVYDITTGAPVASTAMNIVWRAEV